MAFTDSHGNPVDLPEGTSVAWRISAYAVITKGEKYLMVQSGSGQWIFPGGGVEESETIADAVIRECSEETGYSVTTPDTQPIYMREQQFYHTREDAFYHSVQLFYRVGLTTDEPDPDAMTDRDKLRAVDWIDLASIDLGNIHPTLHELVQILKN